MAQVDNKIILVPAEAYIQCAITASVAMKMNAMKKDGTAFDLTPYAVTAPFVSDAFTPPVEAWTVLVEGGSVRLSLTKAETAALAPAGPVTWHWAVWLDHATLLSERLLFARGNLGLVKG